MCVAQEDFSKQIYEKLWIPILLRKPISLLAEWYFKINLPKFDAKLSVTPHIVEKLKQITKNVF